MTLDQLSHLTPAMSIVVGAVILLFGRKLFWLFVAVMGFLLGMQFGSQVMVGAEQWVVIAVAIGLGLLGMILAIVLQKVAIVLAGAAAGGLWALHLAEQAGLASPLPLVAFVVVAILAAILASLLFDWALIILSALTGASLIVQGVTLTTGAETVLWIVLLAVGIIVQARLRERRVVAD